MGKQILLEVRQGAQVSQIGAKDNEEEHLVIVRDVAVIVVALGVLEDVEDFGEILKGEVSLVEMEGLLTLLHVMSMGCVAIWHVIAPFKLLSRKVEVVGSLLEARQDLGKRPKKPW